MSDTTVSTDEDTSDIIFLTKLPRELRKITNERATYQRLYRMLTNGDLPGEQKPNGRLFVYRRDIPQILEALGAREFA
jgi:hypothetical protein